jgi:hypothetical protein
VVGVKGGLVQVTDGLIALVVYRNTDSAVQEADQTSVMYRSAVSMLVLGVIWEG